jgi:hypothetical protein
MQNDLLQQLRDIHTPFEAGWWPPAPGWWVLLALALIALVYLIRSFREQLRKRQPIKQARTLYAEIYHNYRTGVISQTRYLHASNELLKRLVIHGLGRQSARKINDRTWLKFLDNLSGRTDFCEGPGRLLGNQRFHENPEVDVEALHPILERFFKEARP